MAEQIDRKISALKTLRKWKEDPVQFVKDNFKITPDEWQKDALLAFPTNKRMAFVASKGVGKTALLAWMIWNFLATRPYPKIAATSISFDNLSDGLRAELAFWQNKSPFLKKYFTVTKTRVSSNENSEIWFCSLRGWSRTADAQSQALTLAGLHADYMLFVCDEVGSYPESIIATAEAALASGIESKLIICGNPTDIDGPLYRVTHKNQKDWYVQHINSDPDNPKRSPRVSLEWAKQQIETYGRDSAWVKINVFGEFPESGLNHILSPAEIDEATRRFPDPSQYQHFQKRLGVDVARFGGDATILFPRQGCMAFNPVKMQDAKTQDIVSRIILAVERWGNEVEFVDGTGGFGAGVVDSLIAMGRTPYEVHFASKANDPRYANIRSEMYFSMANWVKKNGCIPNDPELIEEMNSITYAFNSKGQFIIENKEQIKQRLGRSPDKLDALILSFFIPDGINLPGFESSHQDSNKIKSEYDPFNPSN